MKDGAALLDKPAVWEKNEERVQGYHNSFLYQLSVGRASARTCQAVNMYLYL